MVDDEGSLNPISERPMAAILSSLALSSFSVPDIPTAGRRRQTSCYPPPLDPHLSLDYPHPHPPFLLPPLLPLTSHPITLSPTLLSLADHVIGVLRIPPPTGQHRERRIGCVCAWQAPGKHWVAANSR